SGNRDGGGGGEVAIDEVVLQSTDACGERTAARKGDEGSERRTSLFHRDHRRRGTGSRSLAGYALALALRRSTGRKPQPIEPRSGHLARARRATDTENRFIT